jgi:DMSO/TMAO reductase YedYZ heme-binding membrane subunit
MATLRASLPWPPEKAVAVALAMAPAVWLAWLAYDGALGVRPVTEAIRFSGDWALRLFWLVVTGQVRLHFFPQTTVQNFLDSGI